MSIFSKEKYYNFDSLTSLEKMELMKLLNLGYDQHPDNKVLKAISDYRDGKVDKESLDVIISILHIEHDLVFLMGRASEFYKLMLLLGYDNPKETVGNLFEKVKKIKAEQS